MRRVVIVMLAVVFCATNASSQQSDESTKGAVIKGRAPVSEEVLQVKLPRAQEAELSNGVHLMVLEDHRLPRVSFQIVIPGAGGYYDSPQLTGLSVYTAQMMREGTRNIQDVATRVGYDSEAAFNRAFKRATGCPPAAWRKGAAT